ncbi:PorT family protein [Mucilaginibacter limnophilus]|uniref:PorT family protein n=1 Tax=Mucilaginibacter limnophilus TaxID=1932778 RepID=A0A437MQX0_9SPHI|nr:outer membrane beta-barrel protein [Mucilaginibacter limnophilus]RVU00049.1 PorT family protein [Mucilaginibacter limnophilus]
MKRLFFTVIAGLFTAGAFAQTDTTITTTTTTVITKTDTVVTTDTVKTTKRKFKFSWDANNRDTIRHEAKKSPGWSFGVTLSRIDIGFATLNDNGSFKLSPENEFLRYRSWKSSNFAFDFVQLGYRFNSAFKIYVSGGFEWTKFRLREDVTLQRFQPQLTYEESPVDFDKNNFSFTYFRIPLSFYWRSHDDKDGHRFSVVAGPTLGLLINGYTKQKSDENGTQKFSGGYNLAKVQYGAHLRAGYGGIGFFAKYYFNDMFDDSPAQKGLRLFTVGATVGF